jgi:hypothetical protein
MRCTGYSLAASLLFSFFFFVSGREEVWRIVQGKIKIGTPLHSNLFLFFGANLGMRRLFLFSFSDDASTIRTNLLSFFLCARADVIFPWSLPTAPSVSLPTAVGEAPRIGDAEETDE